MQTQRGINEIVAVGLMDVATVVVAVAASTDSPSLAVAVAVFVAATATATATATADFCLRMNECFTQGLIFIHA